MEKVALPMLLYVTLSVEDCHWMLPVYPLNVNVVLLAPDATDPEPLMVPETEPIERVIVWVAVVLPLEIVMVPV